MTEKRDRRVISISDCLDMFGKEWYTLPVRKRGVEKPAPRLTKILTEAAINTRGWDGPQAQVQHTCPRPKAEGRCADAGLGSIPAEGVDCS